MRRGVGFSTVIQGKFDRTQAGSLLFNRGKTTYPVSVEYHLQPLLLLRKLAGSRPQRIPPCSPAQLIFYIVEIPVPPPGQHISVPGGEIEKQ